MCCVTTDFVLTRPLELKQLLAAEGVEPSPLNTPKSSLDTPTSSLNTPISLPYSEKAEERSPSVAVFKVGMEHCRSVVW